MNKIETHRKKIKTPNRKQMQRFGNNFGETDGRVWLCYGEVSTHSGYLCIVKHCNAMQCNAMQCNAM